MMLLGNSLRQTVHTHCASVHQAAKLIAALLRVAGVTAGLAESNGSLPSGLWFTSPAGWLPRTGISSRTLRSVIEYGLPLPFTLKIGWWAKILGAIVGSITAEVHWVVYCFITTLITISRILSHSFSTLVLFSCVNAVIRCIQRLAMVPRFRQQWKFHTALHSTSMRPIRSVQVM